jgi:glycosyltransferase involved in cell wall biosynthesis
MMDATVVVPTYRRPDLLDRCLAALAIQEYDPAAFEVIVADDAACEATRRQVAGWAERSSVAFHYVAPAARGPAAARNAGWRSGRGRVVAFTDDDCTPDPRWLAGGLATLSEAGAAAASGRVIVPIPERPTDYERDAAGLASAQFVTANCFVRREALEAVGGFDERYEAAWREDSDLQFALLERGLTIARAPGAVVVHPIRPASWGVSLGQQRKSQYNALLYKKFPRRYRQDVQPGPPWHYCATVAALAGAATALLAGAYAPAAAAAVAWAALTSQFCLRRLRGTSQAPTHLAEMAVTSALIPPLSVFWRLYGAWRFRVLFL